MVCRPELSGSPSCSYIHISSPSKCPKVSPAEPMSSLPSDMQHQILSRVSKYFAGTSMLSAPSLTLESIFVDDYLPYADSATPLQCFQGLRKIMWWVYISISYTDCLSVFQMNIGQTNVLASIRHANIKRRVANVLSHDSSSISSFTVDQSAVFLLLHVIYRKLPRDFVSYLYLHCSDTLLLRF